MEHFKTIIDTLGVFLLNIGGFMVLLKIGTFIDKLGNILQEHKDTK